MNRYPFQSPVFFLELMFGIAHGESLPSMMLLLGLRVREPTSFQEGFIALTLKAAISFFKRRRPGNGRKRVIPH